MTSTVGGGRVVPDAAPAGDADGRSVTSLSPPTRRKPSWIALGALLVGLAGLLGAYAFSVVSDTLSVTVAAHDIAPGEVLGPDDIRVVEMGRTNELRAVQADQQDLILGLAARGPIPGGTVLNTGLFVPPDEVIPSGKAVVGAAFQAGAVPTSAIRAGDVVDMLAMPPDNPSVGAPDVAQDVAALGTATVWAVEGEVSTESVSDRVWISLLVDQTTAGTVSQAASDETLRLVLTGSS